MAEQSGCMAEQWSDSDFQKTKNPFASAAYG
jgi:hypothetical protein